MFGSTNLLADTFERMQQPGGIVGEIVAGVVIGLSALGWICHNGNVSFLAEHGSCFCCFAWGLK